MNREHAIPDWPDAPPAAAEIRQWRVIWKRENNPFIGFSVVYESERAARYRVTAIRRARPRGQGELEWVRLQSRTVTYGPWGEL